MELAPVGAFLFKQAERKLGTSTREPDSDNADVGKNFDAKRRPPNSGAFF